MSCITELLDYFLDFENVTDEDHVNVVYLDWQDITDTIPNGRLLANTKAAEIDKQVAKLVESFLRGRGPRVTIRDSYSIQPEPMGHSIKLYLQLYCGTVWRQWTFRLAVLIPPEFSTS